MQPDRTAELTRLLKSRILILDGAMGTMIQQLRLSEDDFRGGNACGLHDHPHGGRTNGGGHPVSPWGTPTKGYKTRKNKRTDVMIVRRRSATKG